MATTITFYNIKELIDNGSITQDHEIALIETIECKGYGIELFKGEEIEYYLRKLGYDVSLPEWYGKFINIGY